MGRVDRGRDARLTTCRGEGRKCEAAGGFGGWRAGLGRLLDRGRRGQGAGRILGEARKQAQEGGNDDPEGHVWVIYGILDGLQAVFWKILLGCLWLVCK